MTQVSQKKGPNDPTRFILCSVMWVQLCVYFFFFFFFSSALMAAFFFLVLRLAGSAASKNSHRALNQRRLATHHGAFLVLFSSGIFREQASLYYSQRMCVCFSLFFPSSIIFSFQHLGWFSSFSSSTNEIEPSNTPSFVPYVNSLRMLISHASSSSLLSLYSFW
jgi:hypothetical protein